MKKYTNKILIAGAIFYFILTLAGLYIIGKEASRNMQIEQEINSNYTNDNE